MHLISFNNIMIIVLGHLWLIWFYRNYVIHIPVIVTNTNHHWICKRDAASGPSCTRKIWSREFGGWDQKAPHRSTRSIWRMSSSWWLKHGYFMIFSSLICLTHSVLGGMFADPFTQVLCVPQQPLLHDQSAHRRLWKVASPSRKQPKCDTLRNCWIYIENLIATILNFDHLESTLKTFLLPEAHGTITTQHLQTLTLQGCKSCSNHQ